MGKLMERRTDTGAQALKYPKIPQNFEVSATVKNLTVDSLPPDFDFDVETDGMWTELAE